MAARLNPRNSELARQKIQTTQLIKRLQSEALGEIELTQGQRDSAKFLVNKALGNPPDTTNLQLSGGLNNKHTVEFVDGSCPAPGET